MRLRIVLVVLSFTFAGWALGQTDAASPDSRSAAPPTPATLPAQPVDWPMAVRTLADALVGSEHGVEELIPAGTPIRRFDRADPQDRLSLREETNGGAVVIALGYRGVPQTVARDFSAGMRDAAFVPDLIRSQFVLGNEESVRRANETAAQWIASTLQPGVSQPVGVIALWQERPADSPGGASRVQIIFVLLKGQQVAPEQFRITQIVYGDTGQILR